MEHPTTSLAPATLCALTHTLTDPQLAHDTAVIALSGALASEANGAAAPAPWLAEWFDEAARPLFGAAALELRAQAEALTDGIAEHLPIRTADDDHRGLLLGPALVSGRAHPLLLAVVGHELARRAGLTSVVARGEGHDWTVLANESHCMPIGYGRSGAGLTSGKLRAICPHGAAHRIVAALAQGGGAGSADAAVIGSILGGVHVPAARRAR